MSEFVGPDSSLGFGWGALASCFELLDLLDNVVDRCRACRIALIVTPWCCAVGHIVGEGPLGSFQSGRPAVDGTMVGWRMNVVVRIAKGNKTHETLNIIGANVKKLLPSESSGVVATVKFNGEPMLKFHEATKVGVMLLLVGHDPSVGVGVMVKLMLRRLKKELSKKNLMLEKELPKKIDESTKHGGTNRPTQ